MNVKILARTHEEAESTTDLYTLGGKMAGICYMKEDYFDNQIQNTAGAIKRANMTSQSGHHSVFEHGSITFQITGISKILTMLLNSTEMYTTSEKSARYTVMKPETDLEKQVYEKWQELIASRIEEVYPDIDEAQRKKLALENARYMISVFTPTSLAWTTSFRQLIYILNWIDNLCDKLKDMQETFWQKLTAEAKEFKQHVLEVMDNKAIENIQENKNRSFEFFPIIAFGVENDCKEYINDTYQLKYKVSFSSLAQLHRHRTIHYEAYIGKTDITKNGFFIPPILRGTSLEDEWLKDIKSVSYCYPQGTLVDVVEQGRAVKFFDKCKERLCGRAQLETMINTRESLEKFIEQKENLSTRTMLELNKILGKNGQIVTKCEMLRCKEVCRWGSERGIDRLI